MSNECGTCPALMARVAQLEAQLIGVRAAAAATRALIRSEMEDRQTMPRRQLIAQVDARLEDIQEATL